MNDQVPGATCVDDDNITDELTRRAARAPDYRAENEALVALAQELASNPDGVLHRLAELVLQLCNADAAGIAVREPGGGEEIYRWRATAGDLVASLGRTIPAEAGLGGLAAGGQVMLLHGASRWCAAPGQVAPPICEQLLAPWSVDGRTTGMVWASAHRPERQFDREDARLLQSLSRFAGAACRTVGALGATEAARDLLERQVHDRTRLLSASNAALRDEAEQRRQVEQALRDNQATLQAAMEIEAVGVLFYDLDGPIVDSNRAFERMTGYSRDELRQGVNWEQLTPPEFVEATARAAGELAVTGKTAPYSKQFVRKDGTRRWGLFAPTRVTGRGATLRCVEFVVDITERARAEAALRDSESRYRMLFESMDEGYALAEVVYGDEPGEPGDLQFLEANPAALRMARARIVGRRLREIDPDAEQYWVDVCARVARGGGGERLEGYARRLDAWFDVFAFRVGDAAQPRVAMLFQDITERKRREANAAFLVEVSDDLSRLNTAEEIIKTAGAKSAAFFGATRCHVAEVDDRDGSGVFIREWLQDGMPGVGGGAYKLSDLFGKALRAAARGGQPVVVPDTLHDPRIDRANPSYLVMRACLAVPLSKDASWRFLVGLTHSQRRDWRPDEIELLRELAERIWLRLERSRADEALREAQQSLALVVEAAQMGTWDLDLSQDLSGPRSLGHDRIYGYNRAQPAWGQEIARRHILEDDLALFDTAFAQAMHSGDLGVEVRVRWPDGSVRWIALRGRIYFDQSGKPVRGAGVNFDITERKLAEAALRESEARFRALADAAPALIYQFDAAGNLVYLNQRCLDLTGHTPEQLLAAGWERILHPDDLGPYLRTMNAAIRERVSYHQRMRVRVAGGGWHWFDAHGAPLFAATGEYRGHVCLSIDIDEPVKAEEALKDADRRKDEFLATLAHELRNPLAPISNAVQLLRRPDGQRKADRIVEMVGRQVRHIVRLVDDLMEVSRITRGKIELSREPVALAEIVSSAVETSQPLIEQARHQLTVSLPERPVLLDADKVRLTQVLSNLLNNASKYTNPCGQIWLNARCEGGELVISVRDNGIGIGQQQLPHVFEMFAQGTRKPGRDLGGLGIGLTMVRSLVELHGGSVVAASEGACKGSEFTVRLPLPAQAIDEVDRAERGGKPGRPLSGQRILVVDDNRDAADSLALLLEADGAWVRVAYDGRNALAQAASFEPHTVLLDLGMPGMDGYEVAHELRRGESRELRVVALTGWGQEADRRRTSAAGFDHHLTKPVNIEELERLLIEA
jgi:PAS domain S-box-containing protein